MNPAAGIVTVRQVEIARTHVLHVVDGRVVSRALFIPVHQLPSPGHHASPAQGPEGGEKLSDHHQEGNGR